MSIDWKPEAIEAAIDAFYEGSDMRAALDAALAAQGMTAGWINRAVDDAYQEGRADALEEAAAILDEEAEGGLDPRMERIAAAIRALKDAPDDSDDGQPDEMQEWRDFDPDC